MANNALFANPFSLEDLLVFDDETMQGILGCNGFGLSIETLAIALQGASESLLERIEHIMPLSRRSRFLQALRRSYTQGQVENARRDVLDKLFWELTYWKTPELYNELTEGEYLHPDIFKQLEPDIRDKIVLDAGAGSGRASFECARYGASKVYAVEPSPGLLRILQNKLADSADAGRIIPLHGSFDELPLGNESVDLALSCSAFTADPAEGGEAGLAEMRRVTKCGGKIVIIWPRVEDYEWLARHGFQHVTLPVQGEMYVQFRSLESALRCARRFYAGNEQVANYILERRQPGVPFSVLGLNPPRDYCWLTVE
ncbi:MAG TPA: methyltransferase domain-containing protein [Ktedonobacteraceae bacterium]|jgi:ubiquinone/menaquinone biosynthesis C-methylase UbiE|nr:methyltransferase domain-containing protein [Ktedonobacteraceae bacterium]